jgi:hypothetical protein
MRLFEICLSRMTGIPYINIAKLTSDPAGIAALYQRAQLPPKLFEAVKFLVTVIQAMDVASQEKGSARAYESPIMYYKNITKAARGQFIQNLAYFTNMIQKQIDSEVA